MAAFGLIDFLREIAAHGVDDLRTDIIGFRVTIPTSGSITQPSAEKLRTEYDYYVTRIFASMTGAGMTDNVTNADAKFDDVDEIRFNARVSGTGQDMFTTDVELQGLVDSATGRSTHDIDFLPGGFKIRAGADLTPTFTRRATTITTQRIVNVYLVCLLVPKGFERQPRKV